jgi:formyltetrahydrofolate deformylase
MLSPEFLDQCPPNIHHCFLAAFPSANPNQRSVKMIRATAHYVTPELDARPIMEPDVERRVYPNKTVLTLPPPKGGGFLRSP